MFIFPKTSYLLQQNGRYSNEGFNVCHSYQSLLNFLFSFIFRKEVNNSVKYEHITSVWKVDNLYS